MNKLLSAWRERSRIQRYTAAVQQLRRMPMAGQVIKHYAGGFDRRCQVIDVRRYQSGHTEVLVSGITTNYEEWVSVAEILPDLP
jgi:hypothetical protein